MRLIPTDERYYELFDALADEIVSAASLVRELFESLERRDDLVSQSLDRGAFCFEHRKESFRRPRSIVVKGYRLPLS